MNKITDNVTGNYPRRAFLKSAGVTIALPFLNSIPSLRAAVKAGAPTPKRMVFVASALGMNPGTFFPRNFGEDFNPSPVLEPIRDLRKDLTVFSHMDHPAIFTKHYSMNSIYSGVNAKTASAGENISVDQLAAEHVGYDTRYPSVHVSLGGKQGASWSRSGIRVREEEDPKDLFNKMFVNDSAAAKKALELELEQQGSVLDLVKGQAKRLEKSVNPEDRAKLDEYLTAIREAEQKIQGIKKWQNIPKTSVEFDDSLRAHGSMDYPTLAPMMFDLIYLAIQSDVSRVYTTGFGMHNKQIELEGVKTGYHGLSHHGNLPDRVGQLTIIEKFYIEQYARFVQKLKDAETNDGSLLDNTMVFFGSGLGDAARHSNRNLPIILAGGGFKHQGHVDAKLPSGKQMPLNNLYTTMLQNFGVDTPSFNKATGTAASILT